MTSFGWKKKTKKLGTPAKATGLEFPLTTSSNVIDGHVQMPPSPHSLTHVPHEASSKSSNRKRKSVLSVGSVFNVDEDSDEYHEITDGQIDWLHQQRLAAKRQAMFSLEDSAVKSTRLESEGAVLAESDRYWEAIAKWNEALALLDVDDICVTNPNGTAEAFSKTQDDKYEQGCGMFKPSDDTEAMCTLHKNTSSLQAVSGVAPKVSDEHTTCEEAADASISTCSKDTASSTEMCVATPTKVSACSELENQCGSADFGNQSGAHAQDCVTTCERSDFEKSLNSLREPLTEEVKVKAARLLEMKAQALMELREDFPAVRVAEQSVSLHPQWWAAHQTLGRARAGLGELKRALRAFSEAVHLCPWDEDMWKSDLMWAHALLVEAQRMREQAENKGHGDSDNGRTGGVRDGVSAKNNPNVRARDIVV